MAIGRVRRTIPGIVAILSLLFTGVALAAPGGGGGGGSTDPCPGGLEPDLKPIVPHHLQIQPTGDRTFLRLTNGIANLSGGPWHLHPENQVGDEGGTTTAYQDIWDRTAGPSDPTARIVCSVATTQFEFHPAHNHWHIGSVARFGVHTSLDDGTGGAIGPAYVNDRGIAQSFKTTFCLIDWVKIDAKKKTPDVTYWACDRTAPFQGVSVGWIDQYHHSLEGQEIDLTGAPVGVYYLKVHANDDGVFIESNTTNNVAWISFTLSRDSQGNPKVAPLAHSPCDSPSMCGEGLPNR